MVFYVYILSNRKHTIYVGFTSDLPRRFWQHKHRFFEDAFTARYTFNRLVYYEIFDSAAEAAARERQLKGWKRSRKVALIEATNPWWKNLAKSWMEALCLDDLKRSPSA